MALPEWVLKFKEPKTEIKFIKGGYYKYTVDYKYTAQKKRTDKITEKEEFVSSDKNKLRTEKINSSHIDIKNFGLYHLFSTLMKEEMDSFQKYFSKETSEVLFSFAMFRWAYIEWMKLLLNTSDTETVEQFVMTDSTHVFSQSKMLNVNAKGYNSNFDFNKQVRLMYLSAATTQQPVYYRLINGNITDIKSMALCVEEMNIQNVIYIADKGFYSKENIAMMKTQNLQYIIPLQRNNQLINYKPLQKVNFKSKLSYFIYQNRIVWHYSYKSEKENFITFLDEGLSAKEEADYVARISSLPKTHTKEKFAQKLNGFGTLTFSYSINSPKTPQQIYESVQTAQ